MKTLQIFILLSSLLLTNLFANSVANITGLKGEASIDRDDQVILAALGSELHEKDIVTTKDNAKVQVIFKDETIITIGKNSKFAIDEYLFEDKSEPIAKFAMLQGAMRTITGHIGDVAPQKFSVATKTATIGIRGTNFSVFVQEDGSTQAVCTFGAVSVSIAGVSHLVPQGFMLNVTPQGAVEIKPFTPAELNQMKKDSFTATSKETDDTQAPETVVIDTDPQIDNTRIEITPVVIEDVDENSGKATEEEKTQEDTAEVTRIEEEKIAAAKKAAEEKALADAAAAAATTTTTTTTTTTVDPNSILTANSVIADYTQNNVTYNGTFTGSTNESGVFPASGNAKLELSFGLDKADLTLTDSGNEMEAIFSKSPASLDSNSFSGLSLSSGSGNADGKFYGSTGSIVKGSYSMTNLNESAVDASGSYNVTTQNINGATEPVTVGGQ